MRIRWATGEDLPAVRLVTARAYDLYEVLLGYLPPPAGEDFAAWVSRGALWVGERDSEVMAALMAEPRDGGFVVWSAVVDPDWQGEGHGRALLEHAEAAAREAGYEEVRLSTNVLMERNISLYRHCGYRVVGQRPHPDHPAHVLADMAKGVLVGAA